ncbi:hypothetical protein B0O80DRAFT_500694 [Mortierella sp. GBAus27b]|nr:hypothetical protein B0O80DRAFT_500694 [Mortierella sp. GBAus27b]
MDLALSTTRSAQDGLGTIDNQGNMDKRECPGWTLRMDSQDGLGNMDSRQYQDTTTLDISEVRHQGSTGPWLSIIGNLPLSESIKAFVGIPFDFCNITLEFTVSRLSSCNGLSQEPSYKTTLAVGSNY